MIFISVLTNGSWGLAIGWRMFWRKLNMPFAVRIFALMHNFLVSTISPYISSTLKQ